jgi:tetratricopeptide (TPR) repeat protein
MNKPFISFLIIIYISKIFCQQQTIVVSPEQVEFYQYYNEGVARQSLGDFESAIQYYYMALKGVSNLSEPHQNLGLLLDLKGLKNEAIYHHYQATQTSNNPIFKSNSINNLANLLLNNLSNKNINGIQPILSLLEQARLLDRYNTNIAMTAAFSYIEIGNLDEALFVLTDIVRFMNPNHALALLNIGNYYFKLNDFESAIAFYHNALSNNYNNDNNDKLMYLYNNMGQCYRQLNDYYNSYHILLNGLYTFDNNNNNKEFNILSSIIKLLQYNNIKVNNKTIENNNISYPSSLLLWTISNIFTINGLDNNYKYYELYEELLRLMLPN